MATLTPGSIRFAAGGKLYAAPVSTAAPLDVTTVPAAAWKELGYVDTSGVQLTPTITTQAVESWQSAVAVKQLVTAAAFTVQFALQQFDKESVELYFGATFVQAMDGAVTPAPIAGVFQLDLASTPALAETALMVQWNDAAVINRLIVPRASVSSRDAIQLVRTTETKLGVTLSALDSNGRLGYILTNADVGTGS